MSETSRGSSTISQPAGTGNQETMVRSNSVLLISEDEAMSRVLSIGLKSDGYQVLMAPDGHEGIRQAFASRPHAIILDLFTRKGESIRTCEHLRRFTDAPVVVLSQDHDVEDRLAAFAAGADDYVSKPFNLEELFLRLGSILRRSSGVRPGGDLFYDDGYLKVHLATHRVEVARSSAGLTPKEFDLLAALMRNAGQTVPTAELVAAVWGEEYVDQTDFVKVRIHHLRRKIERNPRDPRYIVTERGIGYRFDASGVLTQT